MVRRVRAAAEYAYARNGDLDALLDAAFDDARQWAAQATGE